MYIVSDLIMTMALFKLRHCPVSQLFITKPIKVGSLGDVTYDKYNKIYPEKHEMIVVLPQ